MSRLAILLLCGLLAGNARAEWYAFSQAGYDDGATLSGKFEAKDLNNDGWISGSVFTNFAEIQDFYFSFSGNSLVPAFSETFADLSVLDYQPSRSVLGDQNPEGIAVNWFAETGFTYVTGAGVNGQQGGDIIDWSTGMNTHSGDLVSVSAVPEPAIWLFWLAGWPALALRLRHAR